MDILKPIFKFIFYPLRLMWSRFFYPPLVYSHKTKPNQLGQYILQEVAGSSDYLLLIPGIGTKQFDPDYIFKDDVFNLKDLRKTLNVDKLNIEAIPAPCYPHSYTCFSLEKWAEAIRHRVNVIQQLAPNATISCYGISMGGAATALASKPAKDPARPEKETYVVINTFSSLSMLIWHESWLSFLSFFIHFIPITLLVLIIGLEVCSITYLVGLSAFITAISTLAFSSLYIKIEGFFTSLYDEYSLEYEPYFIRRQHFLIRYIFRGLCKLAHFILWLVYTPTHYIAHSFTYFQLWLLDANAVISNKGFGENCIISQYSQDIIIPDAARLLTELDKVSPASYTRLDTHEKDHGTIPFEEIFKALAG